MTLTAGAASVIITPPIGTAMEGYSARADVSQGVHDELHARAIVIDDGAGPVALVGCDLLGVDRRLVAQARERAAAATGIAAERILIAGTHTHAGPAGLRRGEADALLEVTARHIAGAIAAAYRARRPAVLKVGTAQVASVAQNRRHPNGPVDTTLYALLLDDPDPLRPPVAAALQFACHATVLYHTNLLLSADYPGHAVRAVERLFPGLGVAWFNGACGNVNPVWIAQEHEDAARVGTIAGAAAARLIAELRPLGPGQRVHNIRWDEHLDHPVTAGELVPDVRLRVASRQLDLPIKSFLAPDEYEASLRELDARATAAPPGEEHRRLMEQITRFRTERQVAQRLASRGDRAVRVEVQAIGFSPHVALLGLPGEFFAETAAEIRASALGGGVRHVAVACYANHYAGYVVPASAYDGGGYEVGVTPFAPEAEALVQREALALLREVTE